MALAREEILKIARLSRIAVSEDEMARFENELNPVIDAMAVLLACEMNQASTSTRLASTPLRDDVVEVYPDSRTLLQNSTGLDDDGLISLGVFKARPPDSTG